MPAIMNVYPDIIGNTSSLGVLQVAGVGFEPTAPRPGYES